MWDYRLASKILYEFYYGETEIYHYEEIINSLTAFIRNRVCNNIQGSNIVKVQYKIITQDHQEAIKDILKISDNIPFCIQANLDKQIPEMFIFNDGEVHFNDEIYTRTEPGIFEFVSPNEVADLPGVSGAQLFTNGKKLQHNKLIISSNFIKTGYGENKIHLLPGDWLIVMGENMYHYDFKTAFITRTYSLNHTSSEMGHPIYPESLFKKEVIEAAVKWCADFLPRIPENYVPHVLGYNNIANHKQASLHPVSDFQYQMFTSALFKAIYFCNYEHYTAKIFNITFGSCHKVGHPDIINNALKASGINTNLELNIFPSKSKMDIYSNGLINFNNDVIYSHPDLNLYTYDNLDLTNAPLMFFKGSKFKVLKINTRELESELYDFNLIDTTKEVTIDSKFLYVKLCSEYLKSGKPLESYTDFELIKILQTPQALLATFEDYCIAYESSLQSVLSSCANSLGEIKPQLTEHGWYEYCTKPARVIKIFEAGIINFLGPIPVEAGDFLLVYNSEMSLVPYNTVNILAFAGYLCDEAGNILDNTPHFPGDPEIPLLGFDMLNVG